MKRDAIDFETEKVSVLFRKILLPTLLGTIAMSAVTAIDGIFIGHGVGAAGVGAVNIIVPIFQIVAGLSLMIGAGCSVVSSIHLSRQNDKAARLNITQAFIVSSLFVAILCVAMMSFPRQTAGLLGSSDTLMPQVVDYIMWISPGFIFDVWILIGLFVIRLDGSPRFAMWCNIIPAAVNVVFDWLFIFPLGLGVKGAAMASSICMIVGGLMTMYYMLFKADKLRFARIKMSVTSLRLTARNIVYQCKVGLSTLLGELTLAVLIFIGNLTFMSYLGDAGVGAFGVACYYIPFFFSVGNSIAQSAQPIISYNYGIARWREIRQARRLLLATTLSIGIVVASLFFSLPDLLVALFIDVDSVAGGIAADGFPYFASGIVFYILNVAIIGYYQSVEKIKMAIFWVLLRGGLLIPSFELLPQLFGVSGIWLAMTATELTSTVFVALYIAATRR